jgi:hypothetical protein
MTVDVRVDYPYLVFLLTFISEMLQAVVLFIHIQQGVNDTTVMNVVITVLYADAFRQEMDRNSAKLLIR